MKTTNIINAIVITGIVIVSVITFLTVATRRWIAYNEHVEKNVNMGFYKAEDLPIDGKFVYFYSVVSDIKYSRDKWPDIKQEIIKSDTLLYLHHCSE